MKILFISRNYPPMTGGMENYAFNLHKQFKKHHSVENIILSKSAKHLIWFYPWTLIYGTYLVTFKKIDLVYIGDGLLSSVAFYFQTLLRKKVILTIYGLDVIYNKFFYQKMQKLFLPKVENIIAISQATSNEAIKRGVKKENLTIIPVGVETENTCQHSKQKSKDLAQSIFKINLKNKKILFTIGRLVKRKGVYWFIKNVVSRLTDDYVFLVAGSGIEAEKIKSLIHEKALGEKVYLLGRVSNKHKQLLLASSDAFISPNITIKNDMEGFGIVNLEAGLYNLPVIASDIEGVKDAVINNETGYLVEQKNIKQYIDSINKIDMLDMSQVKTTIINNFSWKVIYNKYMNVINEI